MRPAVGVLQVKRKCIRVGCKFPSLAGNGLRRHRSACRESQLVDYPFWKDYFKSITGQWWYCNPCKQYQKAIWITQHKQSHLIYDTTHALSFYFLALGATTATISIVIRWTFIEENLIVERDGYSVHIFLGSHIPNEVDFHLEIFYWSQGRAIK